MPRSNCTSGVTPSSARHRQSISVSTHFTFTGLYSGCGTKSDQYATTHTATDICIVVTTSANQQPWFHGISECVDNDAVYSYRKNGFLSIQRRKSSFKRQDSKSGQLRRKVVSIRDILFSAKLGITKCYTMYTY